MDYLVIEGHKEAAECFRSESGTAAGLDLDTISDRRAIRTAMESGEVANASAQAERMCPDLLSGNPDLKFCVLQQQLIELIRAGRVVDAVAFAQAELWSLVEPSAANLDALERTMLLLAYDDASACPEAALLSQEQRARTAAQLNAAILAAQSQDKEAALPMLLRRLSLLQEELELRQAVLAPTASSAEGVVDARDWCAADVRPPQMARRSRSG